MLNFMFPEAFVTNQILDWLPFAAHSLWPCLTYYLCVYVQYVYAYISYIRKYLKHTVLYMTHSENTSELSY